MAGRPEQRRRAYIADDHGLGEVMHALWKAPVAWFVLFNLIAVPFLGRALWMFMLQLNASDARLAAVALSLAGAVGILAVNVILTARAARAGLPREGRMALWLVTGATFAITVGFGVFSPLELALALLRMAGA
jgi:hypothetical protein